MLIECYTIASFCYNIHIFDTFTCPFSEKRGGGISSGVTIGIGCWVLGFGLKSLKGFKDLSHWRELQIPLSRGWILDAGFLMLDAGFSSGSKKQS